METVESVLLNTDCRIYCHFKITNRRTRQWLPLRAHSVQNFHSLLVDVICKWIDVSRLGASINEIRSARYPTDLTSRYELHSSSCGTEHCRVLLAHTQLTISVKRRHLLPASEHGSSYKRLRLRPSWLESPVPERQTRFLQDIGTTLKAQRVVVKFLL